jgi:Na+(H+)/acetate symporter ActP
VGVTFLVSINVDSLWDIFYLSSGLLSTTVALPVLSTLNKRINANAAFYSSAGGFIATVFFYFNGQYQWIPVSLGSYVRDTGLEYIVFGMIGATAGFVAGNYFRGDR